MLVIVLCASLGGDQCRPQSSCIEFQRRERQPRPPTALQWGREEAVQFMQLTQASVCQGRLSLYPGGASAPHPKLGGKGFLGPWEGRTKNIDVLMIVVLKLANGFSDYEQVPIGARIVAYCPRQLLQLR